MAVASVHKTLSGLNRRSGRGEGRGIDDESCSVGVHRSSFLLPVSLPVRSRFCSRFQIQLNRTPSHSFQEELLIISMRTSLMVSLHLTRSLSPLIALLRRG